MHQALAWCFFEQKKSRLWMAYPHEKIFSILPLYQAAKWLANCLGETPTSTPHHMPNRQGQGGRMSKGHTHPDALKSALPPTVGVTN